MCGIVGAIFTNVTDSLIDDLSELIIESSIRGLHATGISFYQRGNIHTISEPVPARMFLKNRDLHDCIDEYGNLALIAHCRYSTSDLAYNQPLATESFSLVHNGVITQELPENWQAKYEYVTKTKNDTELLMRSMLDGDDIYATWPDSSMAFITLNASTDGPYLTFGRNGKRPIYYANKTYRGDNAIGKFIVSTKNIAKRAIKNFDSGWEIHAVGCEETLYGSATKTTRLSNIKGRDLQNVL